MKAETTKPLLEVSSLRIAYGPSLDWVVDGVHFVLRVGEALGLVGESGSGKSSVALAILGLLPRGARVEGAIRFDGIDLVEAASVQSRSIRWRRIAIVLQDALNALNPVIPIGEQLAELWVTHEGMGWGEAYERASEALRSVGLDPELSRSYAHELSGGMRQRVAIAMAFALRPELVVVDEPTSALDVVAANALVETLNEARARTGAALLVISHDTSVVARTCDRVAVMREGRIVESGPRVDVLTNPRDAYTRRLLDAVPRLPVDRT